MEKLIGLAFDPIIVVHSSPSYDSQWWWNSLENQ